MSDDDQWLKNCTFLFPHFSYIDSEIRCKVTLLLFSRSSYFQRSKLGFFEYLLSRCEHLRHYFAVWYPIVHYCYSTISPKEKEIGQLLDCLYQARIYDFTNLMQLVIFAGDINARSILLGDTRNLRHPRALSSQTMFESWTNAKTFHAVKDKQVNHLAFVRDMLKDGNFSNVWKMRKKCQ